MKIPFEFKDSYIENKSLLYNITKHKELEFIEQRCFLIAHSICCNTNKKFIIINTGLLCCIFSNDKLTKSEVIITNERETFLTHINIERTK